MERKIRVAAVDYLNTKPLIFGLERGIISLNIELILDNPSNVARMLINDKVDVGLVPVTCTPLLKNAHTISDYCIGCDGEVSSVCIFSEVPMNEIETVLLDYQSNTSVALFRLLAKDHWKISPMLAEGSPGYEKQITGTTAGLVIGDRALKQRNVSKYMYDLGSAWKDFTGLPFVFATWVSNKSLPGDFIAAFNASTSLGLRHLNEIVAANPFAEFDLNDYYKNKIDFKFNDDKKKALQVFLNYL
ncbi:MAG: menaquinone biosynthesis protein [Ferruginibacter sp.]